MSKDEIEKRFNRLDEDFNAILLKDNKGELAQRIIKEIDWDDKARNDPAVYFKGKNILKHSIIFNVLDEAKKERPLLKVIGLTPMYDEFLLDYALWFKKWFGDDKPC